jgi:hypothetical protein
VVLRFELRASHLRHSASPCISLLNGDSQFKFNSYSQTYTPTILGKINAIMKTDLSRSANILWENAEGIKHMLHTYSNEFSENEKNKSKFKEVKFQSLRKVSQI